MSTPTSLPILINQNPLNSRHDYLVFLEGYSSSILINDNDEIIRKTSLLVNSIFSPLNPLSPEEKQTILFTAKNTAQEIINNDTITHCISLINHSLLNTLYY